ncbi:MAG: NUDIX domain-containing protein [Bryobacteraceae bacterium]|nr:NUDIX domain-containing protein [Bryobacteraceae bacterium]
MSFSPATAIEFVTALPPGEDDKSQELTLGMLRHTPEPLSRHQYLPGHLTCTGIVLHPSLESFLLIHHRRLDRWLAPGGHVEPEDESPRDAAAREVREETGVIVLPGEAFLAGIDVHGIPPKSSEPYHLHHDLKFGLVATAAGIALSDETKGVRWCGFAETVEIPASIRRAAERTRAHYAAG